MTNGRPAPTSDRGKARAAEERARQAKRIYGNSASPDAILAADGSNRLEYLAWHAARYDRKRAERRASGRDPGLPWDEYAADLDAHQAHYGDSPIYAGAYTPEQFTAAADRLGQRSDQLAARRKAAPPMTASQREHIDRIRVAGQLQTSDRQPFSHGSTRTAAEVLAELDALDPRPSFSGGSPG